MKKHLSAVPLAVALLAAACDEAATPLSEEGGGITEVVVTQGIAAPRAVLRPFIPSNSDLGAEANLGGSSAEAVALKAASCSPDNAQVITITYTVTGRQEHAASFEIDTRWEFDGSSWSSTLPTTVNVASRTAGAAATTIPVSITVVNGSSTNSGSSTFDIEPTNLITSAPAALDISGGTTTIYVEFENCATANTAPWINVPADFTAEATTSAGAIVSFATLVTAGDAEDGSLTATCAPASGTQFGFGPTSVSCSVTDSEGVTTTAAPFTITVVDTTDPVFTSIPTGTVTRIAQGAGGWEFDLASFSITAADVNGVSEPVSIACTPAAGAMLAIGSTTQVTCKATDSRNNESVPSTFDLHVTLDLTGVGFLTPLRMNAPFSAHKRGSAIPHKFPAPKYEDGTLATDLAAGLNLTLQRIGGTTDASDLVEDVPGAGSTTWRYDAVAGHYIFNVKSLTSWTDGQWQTTVSYAGIKLAETEFGLRK